MSKRSCLENLWSFNGYLLSSVSFFPGPTDLNFISFLMSSKNFFILSDTRCAKRKRFFSNESRRRQSDVFTTERGRGSQPETRAWRDRDADDVLATSSGGEGLTLKTLTPKTFCDDYYYYYKVWSVWFYLLRVIFNVFILFSFILFINLFTLLLFTIFFVCFSFSLHVKLSAFNDLLKEV